MTGRAETFATIVADPDWAYQNFGQAKHGAARAHYPGSDITEIAAVPVSRWARRDSTLLLWATLPKLDEAVDVVPLHVAEQDASQRVAALHASVPAIHHGGDIVRPIVDHDHAAADQRHDGVGIDPRHCLDQTHLIRLEGEACPVTAYNRAILPGELP